MRSRTWPVAFTMSCIFPPASSASAVPAWIMSSESRMTPRMSCAAAALRCARLRTSEATTANPRPCSPARAASTAALRARMLVWKAMPSMIATMSAMRLELAWMVFIRSTTFATISPPLEARVAAACASVLASREVSACIATLDDICSVADDASSRDTACCSASRDRSALPLPRLCAVPWTESAAWRTRATVAARLSFISLSAARSCPVSSVPAPSMRAVRSPLAIVWTTPRAAKTGFSTDTMIQVASRANTTMPAAETTIRVQVATVRASTAALSAAAMSRPTRSIAARAALSWAASRGLPLPASCARSARTCWSRSREPRSIASLTPASPQKMASAVASIIAKPITAQVITLVLMVRSDRMFFMACCRAGVESAVRGAVGAIRFRRTRWRGARRSPARARRANPRR